MTLKVLHFITHLAVGGATEPTITTCQGLDPHLFEATLLCGLTDAGQQTLLPQAQAAGVRVQSLPSLHRAMHPGADWAAYRDLVAWMRHGHWDILHTHGSKAGILGRLAAARVRIPVIIHNVHGWGHHGHMSRLARTGYILAERHAARVTDRFVLDATANRDKGLRDGIGHFAQYETIYNGIDIARFRSASPDCAALRRSLNIPADAPVVGTVGRLAAQKAPDDFVRMAALVHARRPETHFVWVGGGPLEEAMRGWIAQAGLTEKVHLLGYRDDVPDLLRIMDIFALVSLWEGLPRVFAQAMCAGLPIVATEVDGAPEAIVPGENGFLVAPRDMASFAGHVLSLLDNPALRRDLGQRGWQKADPMFNERHMVQQIEDLYLRLAREKGLPVPSSPIPSSPIPTLSASSPANP